MATSWRGAGAAPPGLLAAVSRGAVLLQLGRGIRPDSDAAGLAGASSGPRLRVFILNTGRFHTQLARQVKGKRAHAYLQRRVAFYRVQGIALAPISGAKPSMTEQPSSAVGSLVALT